MWLCDCELCSTSNFSDRVLLTDQLSRLHMILKPFMLRRVKKDVENELSDKVCIVCLFSFLCATTTQLGCCLCVLLTACPFLDPGLNEKIFKDTAGSAMMDTPGKN